MKITALHKNEEHVKHTLGIALYWLADADFHSPSQQREKAAKVFDRNYQHGGGWRPLQISAHRFDLGTGIYKFPGDPPQKPVAKIEYGDEVLYAYDHAMWAIVQKDGSFEIARMD